MKSILPGALARFLLRQAPQTKNDQIAGLLFFLLVVHAPALLVLPAPLIFPQPWTPLLGGFFCLLWALLAAAYGFMGVTSFRVYLPMVFALFALLLVTLMFMPQGPYITPLQEQLYGLSLLLMALLMPLLTVYIGIYSAISPLLPVLPEMALNIVVGFLACAAFSALLLLPYRLGQRRRRRYDAPPSASGQD